MPSHTTSPSKYSAPMYPAYCFHALKATRHPHMGHTSVGTISVSANSASASLIGGINVGEV